MSTFTTWTTSELLVLFEAIQFCQKTKQNDWEYVSELVKTTMKETGLQMVEKYNGYGCASQYNLFDVNHKEDAQKKNVSIVDFAVDYYRQIRVMELEREIREREARVAELKSQLN